MLRPQKRKLENFVQRYTFKFRAPEFSFLGFNICVDFDLRDSKKGEYKHTEKNKTSLQKY